VQVVGGSNPLAPTKNQQFTSGFIDATDKSLQVRVVSFAVVAAREGASLAWKQFVNFDKLPWAAGRVFDFSMKPLRSEAHLLARLT